MNNIKRIIFDLDNTLIPWSNEYLEAVKKAVKEYNISKTYEEMDSNMLHMKIIIQVIHMKTSKNILKSN